MANNIVKPKNPWSLYSNVDGYLVAEAEITSGVQVAITLGSFEKAFEFMAPILRKHEEFGANDTDVRDLVLYRLEKHFESNGQSAKNIVAVEALPPPPPSPLDLLRNAVAANALYWAEIRKFEVFLEEAVGQELSDYNVDKLTSWVENLASGVDSPESEQELKDVLSALRIQRPSPRG